MRVGIVDADLAGRVKHRFPNLACMKLSGWYKACGHEVELVTSYDDISKYDKVFISKVFTDTPVPDEVLNLQNVEYGGTGFFYDKAEPLPPIIEHHTPDYDLYTEYVRSMLSSGKMSKNDASYYLDYSIGFTTRGCIRGCSFCVNQNYRKCSKHSPVSEFLDSKRKYIMLLDDNVFACPQWRTIFNELNSTGKRFQFRQGLDERLLTEEKCDVLFNSNWKGDYIFAFDNIKDRPIIETKLRLIRERVKKRTDIMFYCFCAYNHTDPEKLDEEFWLKDIEDLFERIRILMSFGCRPYIMRHKNYKESPYYGMYVSIASWCNQPSIIKKKSLMEFCKLREDHGSKSTSRYVTEFAIQHPDIAEKYFNMKWSDFQ